MGRGGACSRQVAELLRSGMTPGSPADHPGPDSRPACPCSWRRRPRPARARAGHRAHPARRHEPGAAAARAVPGERSPGHSCRARERPVPAEKAPGVRFVEPNRRLTPRSQPSDPASVGAPQHGARAARGRLPATARPPAVPTPPDPAEPRSRGQRLDQPDEVPANGLDDDGNGFIDDVHGAYTVGWDGDPAMVGTARRWRASPARGDNGVGLSGWRERPPDAGQGPSRPRLGHDGDDDRRAALRARRGRPDREPCPTVRLRRALDDALGAGGELCSWSRPRQRRAETDRVPSTAPGAAAGETAAADRCGRAAPGSASGARPSTPRRPATDPRRVTRRALQSSPAPRRRGRGSGRAPGRRTRCLG